MKYEEILNRVVNEVNKYSACLIAIDGRCASGKSVFGKRLSERLQCPLLHMDDFFLRPEQRSMERYAAAGENVDHERFEKEVLVPVSQGKAYWYQPFDCQKMGLSEGQYRKPEKIMIVEGSYSLHPQLRKYYDLKIFLTVERDVQMDRIRRRNPDKVQDFKNRWIPYEEKYFKAYQVEKEADFVFDTTALF